MPRVIFIFNLDLARVVTRGNRCNLWCTPRVNGVFKFGIAALYHVFFHLNIGTLFRCCVQCAEMAAGLYAIRGVEMAQERTGPVTRG